jgi:hypothetical protein
MKIRNIILIFSLFLFILSCKKEVIDLDKHSNRMEFEKGLVGPIVKGSLLLSDLIDQNNDNPEELVIDGDTVKLHIIRDSILSYNTSDIVVIPLQASAPYNIHPQSIIDVSAFPEDFIINELITDTVYTLVLQNSMRLDSVILNAGMLNIDAINSFDYTTDLNIYSASIVDPNNQP